MQGIEEVERDEAHIFGTGKISKAVSCNTYNTDM